MLESHRIQQEIVKLQIELNKMPLELRADDPEAETRMAERHSKTNKVIELQTKMIEVLDTESREAEAVMARSTNMNAEGWTPELREFRELGKRVTIADYVAAALEERHVEGAAAEYNQHVLGTYAQGDYPMEMLLDRDVYYDMDSRTWGALVRDEKRTEVTGIVGTAGSPSFIDRLLASSDAAYIGASFPAVGAGRHSYPVVSGTSVAATIARGTAEAPAGGLTIVTADPERVQQSYEYAAADELQVPGIANGLTSDARQALASGLDKKVILATISGLSMDNTIARQTMALIFGAFGGMVDGLGARDVRDTRLLVSTDVYTDAAALSISNVGHFFTLMPHDRYRASSHLAGNTAIGYRTGAGNLPRLIVPVWRRGTLLRDTGRLQLQGTVTLTAVMYADVIVVNADLHKKFTFATS